MKRTLHRWLLLISLSSSLASTDEELPLCPTNMQYFPQNLPMHCRMPGNSESRSFPDMQQYPTLPPLPQSFYQSPPPDKQPNPIPIQIPPFPGMPGPGGPMGQMPVLPPMPMPMPMPMVGGPPHKLPVIVMPFYSPDTSFKKPPNNHRGHKRPPHKSKKKYDSDTDTSSEEASSGSGATDNSNSSNEHGFWKGRRKARRRMTRRFNKHHKLRKRIKKKEFLTPILQYVTKDGYVIFEKKISKNEAKDWLGTKKDGNVIEEMEKNDYKDARKDREDKEINLLAEESPKTEVEELPMRNEEKSVEGMSDAEATTQRVVLRRHRIRANTLLNKPGPEP